MPGPPRLTKLHGNVHQLYVADEPFLIRAAELNNSSLSSAQWMTEIWPRMVEMNVNTVLGSVGWDQIEPDEGRFDFTELDQIIVDARQHALKLILLWFGCHKNGESPLFLL